MIQLYGQLTLALTRCIRWQALHLGVAKCCENAHTRRHYTADCSQGLFFYHTKKVGFVAGVKWGSGILIQHILDERGRESWSAPVLYKVHEVSLGLLAGSFPCISVRLTDGSLALPVALSYSPLKAMQVWSLELQGCFAHMQPLN